MNKSDLKMMLNASAQFGDDDIKAWDDVTKSYIGDSLNYDWYKTHYVPYREYVHVPIREDHYQKAHRIVKMLFERKLLMSNRVRDVLELVETIAQEL
jgi:hypothetical protein